jgi:hypothetical protein
VKGCPVTVVPDWTPHSDVLFVGVETRMSFAMTLSPPGGSFAAWSSDEQNKRGKSNRFILENDACSSLNVRPSSKLLKE